MATKLLVILGAGGHARSVGNVAQSAGFTDLIFIDENPRENETIFDFPVLKEIPHNLHHGWACIPAAGDNQRRKQQFLFAKYQSWPLTSVISPHAIIGKNAEIAEGTFIAHYAHIGPSAKIGEGCIINTSAIVEHECEVGHFTHVSINAALAGRSKLGNNVFLCAGATVIDAISIASNITIGAGTVVTKSIKIQGIYVGVPAKLMNMGYELKIT